MAWAGPSVRVMNIFWRVTQAVPDATFGTRLFSTSLVLVAESIGNDEWLGANQWFLALRPWASEEAADAYERAIADQGVPAIPQGKNYHDATAFQTEDLEFLTLVNIAYFKQ